MKISITYTHAKRNPHHPLYSKLPSLFFFLLRPFYVSSFVLSVVVFFVLCFYRFSIRKHLFDVDNIVKYCKHGKKCKRYFFGSCLYSLLIKPFRRSEIFIYFSKKKQTEWRIKKEKSKKKNLLRDHTERIGIRSCTRNVHA